MKKYYLAVDIGASSGRHILGCLENGKIVLEEIHRFSNGIEKHGDALCWNLDRLFEEVLYGMAVCRKMGKTPCSIGIDTWAVDYVLLNEQGRPAGKTYAYRDHRTEGIDAEVNAVISSTELYTRTGIQKQIFNTIYQLAAAKKEEPHVLEEATTLLMIPDYFCYRLTGQKKTEYTNATTTQLLNVVTKTWDYELLEKLGIKSSLFTEISSPGTFLGRLTPGIQERVGYDTDVIQVATHDTASAVAAVPANESDFVYISSGTWSLMGVEQSRADCSEESRLANMTNEGGYEYRFRFLKNIMGLWMIQSVRREFDKRYTFDELCALAEECSSITSRVNVDDNRFLSPESMISAIQDFCRETGQSVPLTPGELASVIYHSLAEGYCSALENIEKLTGKTYPSINIVGGGSNDTYLNQMTADAAGRIVYSGPKEATAIGNLLVQMIEKNGGQYLIGIAENIESEKHAEYVYAETEGADHNQKSDIRSTLRINVTKRIIEEYHRFTINPVFVDKIPFDTTIIENFFKDIIDLQEKETITSFFKPENIEKQFYKGKTESGFDYRIRTETGSVRWIHINTRLLLKPLTNELMAYCYIKDIHDRKISESLIQNIAENEYDYIMYIDAENDTYFIYSHTQSGSPMPSFESNSYESERIKNINLYVLEEDRERVLEQMSLKTVCRELDKNRVYSVYLGIDEQDGRISRKKLSYSYIQKEQKLIRLSRTDVTKIYEDEQEKRNVLRDALAAAEQASHAKTEFLSRMSHEMRTPMNAIMGLISLVQQQIKSEPAVQENLQKIQSSAQYLLSIINDVLDMSRIESGKMTLQKEKIDITDFIGKVDSIILSQAKAKGLEYTSRISDSVFHSFVGDSLKLQQVLVNILGNAVKFTPKGGSVLLIVEQIFFLNTEQKRKLRFTVSDTGIGIKKKYLPLIFDSFTQQDNSISTNFGGTGLGLAITKNILTMMGGSISVKSREGEGSVFTIEVVLPIYDEFTANKYKGEVQSGKEESLKASSVHINTASDFYKGKRLLLVDDNEMNIDVAKQLLVRKGFTVDTAENGKIAVELFEKSSVSYYSAILMDVRMPVMDGLTAARLIRSSKHEDSARIPIIAMTANAFSEDIKQTQESGMNAHLSKPIDVDVLYTTISCLIAGTC